MSKIKKLIACIPLAMVLVLATNAHSQTIEDLTNAARGKRLAELQKAASPTSQGGALGMSMSDEQRSTVLLSIYGINKDLISEISDSGTSAKYRVGDELPSGWKVVAISKRNVDLKRNGKSKTLSFWSIVENSPQSLSGPVPPGMPLPTGR